MEYILREEQKFCIPSAFSPAFFLLKKCGAEEEKISTQCEHYQKIKLNSPPEGKDEDKII